MHPYFYIQNVHPVGFQDLISVLKLRSFQCVCLFEPCGTTTLPMLCLRFESLGRRICVCGSFPALSTLPLLLKVVVVEVSDLIASSAVTVCLIEVHYGYLAYRHLCLGGSFLLAPRSSKLVFCGSTCAFTKREIFFCSL